VSRLLRLPIENVEALRAGDEVEITGTVLTGRDLACAKLSALLNEGQPLPVDLKGQLIYFVGPSPAPPGKAVGSAGPTTSGRMNRFIPAMLAAGLRGVIGKGYLSDEAKAALVKHRGVYLGAIGGTGALLSQSIREVKVIAFPELLSEAIHAMTFEKFPVVVLFDCHGGDLYTASASPACERGGAAAIPPR
jgi:fumarate hydratase subunit beta